jgi:hypothetical protein
VKINSLVHIQNENLILQPCCSRHTQIQTVTLAITLEYSLTNTASVKGIACGMVGELRIINNLVLKNETNYSAFGKLLCTYATVRRFDSHYRSCR